MSYITNQHHKSTIYEFLVYYIIFIFSKIHVPSFKARQNNVSLLAMACIARRNAYLSQQKNAFISIAMLFLMNNKLVMTLSANKMQASPNLIYFQLGVLLKTLFLTILLKTLFHLPHLLEYQRTTNKRIFLYLLANT